MDRELFRQYYVTYYKDMLGLADWEVRTQGRFHEDEVMCALVKSKLFLLNMQLPSRAKVMIIGGGTGAELMAFHELGYEAWMIEPDPTACRLARQKAEDKGIDPSYVVQSRVENLPFKDAFFDFIWSFTVLEHVQCYKIALAQISRTLKINAWAFLQFPDYRCIYEAHYKLYLPLFLPKWINAFILMARKKNPRFYLHHTNNINVDKFLNVVRELPLTVLRIHTPWPTDWKNNRTWKMNIAYYMVNWFNIEYSPSFYLKKNEL